MAEVPEQLFLDAVRALVEADRDWVPTERRARRSTCGRWSSPLDPFLGVRPSRDYQFLLFASPAGAYFPGGVQPVTVWLSTEYVRAAPGGTGEAKCAGNYAASLVAQAQAAEQGCDQVVWLDAVEHRYVEEMGGMNLYFVYADGRLVTPALTGTLLPGVTRDSILTLGARPRPRRRGAPDQHRGVGGRLRRRHDQRGLRLRHRRGRDAGRRGQARAAAASRWPTAQPGAVTMKVREALLGIQQGTAPDPHGWMHAGRLSRLAEPLTCGVAGDLPGSSRGWGGWTADPPVDRRREEPAMTAPVAARGRADRGRDRRRHGRRGHRRRDACRRRQRGRRAAGARRRTTTDLPDGSISLPVIEQDGTSYVPVFTSEATMATAAPDIEDAVPSTPPSWAPTGRRTTCGWPSTPAPRTASPSRRTPSARCRPTSTRSTPATV